MAVGGKKFDKNKTLAHATNMIEKILLLRHFGFTIFFLLNCFLIHFVKAETPLTLTEAIEKRLLQQPAIQIAIENVNIQEGIAQSSAAPFDPNVNSEYRSIYSKDLLRIGLINARGPCPTPPCQVCGVEHTDLRAHEEIGHLDLTKKFREGTIISFNLDFDKMKNPLNCPRKLTTGTMGFEIHQPLLRGFGQGLEKMTELANIQEIDAVRFDTLQSISSQVLETINAYWDTVATRKILEANLASEERLTKLVEKIKYIIEHKQLAEGDILQPLAQLSAQIVARMAAEQNHYIALQQLKLAIGEWDEVYPCSNGLFVPVDDFPFIETSLYSFPHIFCQLFPLVYTQRFDILASLTREQVYYSLLLGAKNLELPQLDVVGRADLRGAKASRNRFSGLEFDKPQKDLTVGVVFSMPLYQSEARGLIRQYRSLGLQAMAQTQLLKQQTLTEISEALRNQFSLQQEVIKANESAEEYDQLLKNETKKLQAGYSTLFILLSYESTLTNSIIQYIQLQNLFAKNIAEIRFLTGTLLRYSPWTNCQPFVIEDPKKLPFTAQSSG